MKKLISLLSTAVMSVSVLSFPVNAESDTSTLVNVYEMLKGRDLDFNNDGNINNVDLGEYVSYFMSDNKDLNNPVYKKIAEKGDLNNDGEVTLKDMTYLGVALCGGMSTCPPGDVNLDGYITGTDATLVLSCYTEMLSETPEIDIRYYDLITHYGDMDGDGKITGSDATMILQVYTEASSK